MIDVPVTIGANINIIGALPTDAADRLDEGWSETAGEITFTGAPDHVAINAMIHQAIANNANIQRSSPELILQKNGVTVITSATGYIRDSGDHEQSSNAVYWIDPNPGVNPVYRIMCGQDTTITGAVSVVNGFFQAQAFL